MLLRMAKLKTLSTVGVCPALYSTRKAYIAGTLELRSRALATDKQYGFKHVPGLHAYASHDYVVSVLTCSRVYGI